MTRIAIIDDDASERAVLKGLVEESGFEVAGEGENGEEALAICSATSPDLVIMDVKMPVMDGIEAAREINRSHPTPVVLLTATDDPETIRRAVEAGVMAYLTKPVRLEDLLPAVELAVSRFREFEVLRKENLDLKKTLEARKIIEKAKGILMETQKVSEKEAFTRIRKESMDRRKSMKEIAEEIIISLGE
ncbi:MAG TPA: response regulator [Thermodesulfobacteriota bacterium]|nr:response regulator [Thermodesulfobacteriota bacterium]